MKYTQDTLSPTKKPRVLSTVVIIIYFYSNCILHPRRKETLMTATERGEGGGRNAQIRWLSVCGSFAVAMAAAASLAMPRLLPVPNLDDLLKYIGFFFEKKKWE